jgi:hypothetical protein
MHVVMCTYLRVIHKCVQIEYWEQNGGLNEGNQFINQEAPSVCYVKHCLVAPFTTAMVFFNFQFYKYNGIAALIHVA